MVVMQIDPVSGSEAAPRVWKIALNAEIPGAGYWAITCGTIARVTLQVTPLAGGNLVDVPGISIVVEWVAAASGTGALEATAAPLFALPGEFLP